MPDIKAIPTEYNGVQYRSRTEARWAILLDLLRIKYHYEPGRVFTGTSNYIPDFVLPELTTILEIKGSDPTPSEIEKLSNVTLRADPDKDHSCQRVIAVGPPGGRLLQVGCFGYPLKEHERQLRQCVFCGYIDIDHVPEDLFGSIGPLWHRCTAAVDLARLFDIDNCFWDFDGGPKPSAPPLSPILTVAIQIAKSICFDGSNLYERLDREKKAVDILWEQRVYSSSVFMSALVAWMIYLKKDGAPAYRLNPRWASELPDDFRPFEIAIGPKLVKISEDAGQEATINA